MARGKKTTTAAAAAAEPILHFAARMEDRVHGFREQRAKNRGHIPTVIPYTGYGAPGWVRVLCRVLLVKPGLAASGDADEPYDEPDNYPNVRGWRSFTSVPIDDVSVTIGIDGREILVTADRGGVVDARVDADLTPGWHDITIRTEGSAQVTAPVFIVDTSVGFGIISDIDDTVMVTALPRPFLAALYERLTRENPGSPVIYLSTGAWNVAPTLTRFLSRNLYPSGPLLLTDWGPTHDRWFRSGVDHKSRSLRRIAEEFPTMRWLLIGDDGQHDEMIYGDFCEAHPANVRAVAIRQLSTSEAVLAGGRSKAEEKRGTSDVPWFYSPDGAGLAGQLAEVMTD